MHCTLEEIGRANQSRKQKRHIATHWPDRYDIEHKESAMSEIDHDEIIGDWITATNTHDVQAYLSFFTDEPVLDDPSVGSEFRGRDGVAAYYESYFIGYDTQTRLISTEQRSGSVHADVHFTGSFPGGQTGGTFDITFDDRGLIQHIRADLT